MNLLVSSGVFHPAKGGAESILLDLSRHLVARGHAVTVVTRRLDDTNPTESVDGVEIVRLPYPMPYETIELDRELFQRSPAILYRLGRLLRARRISTVCVGLLDMSMVYLLALRVIRPYRLVLYLHGGETRWLPRVSLRYRRLFERCLRESDAVVAVSRALGEEAAAFVPAVRGRLAVIENGIDVAAVNAAPPLRRARPYILYAGRLAGEKNVATIIRAFARAAGRLPGIDLLLVGTGPEEESLAHLPSELGLSEGRVEFVGAVERRTVFSYMKGARLLVLASETEGHSLVVIEARVAGIPALGPRVTGLVEMIEPGVDGDLYAPGDAEGLAELMARYAPEEPALAALRSRIAEGDRERYDLSHVIERHERILAG